MLFHLNVNISETREIELPNINTNKFIFYMYISASINKKKLKSGNVVHSMEGKIKSLSTILFVIPIDFFRKIILDFYLIKTNIIFF